jgi:hypothetical protein
VAIYTRKGVVPHRSMQFTLAPVRLLKVISICSPQPRTFFKQEFDDFKVAFLRRKVHCSAAVIICDSNR